jgi:small subunit ribosomal protein S6
MRQYELMVIYPVTADVTDKTATALVEKIVGAEAKTTSVVVLGKKQLAYPIQKQTEGIYVLATLEGEHVHVNELEKKVALGSGVLRYLLTIKN